MWFVPGNSGNWVLCRQLLGYTPVLTTELCFPLGLCGVYITTACNWLDQRSVEENSNKRHTAVEEELEVGL
jgi:hypothetical protein